MLLDLDEWEATYLQNEVLLSTEGGSLEFKASEKFGLKTNGKVEAATLSEIARQVSAFSNARSGFLVFGVTDSPRTLDGGVPSAIGNTQVKQWIEQTIAGLLVPQVVHCAAKFIRVDAFHAVDRGVLVVSIPLSENRPHWPRDENCAYLRVGEHSLPMAPQTLLDMATRTGAAVADIEDLGVPRPSFKIPDSPSTKQTAYTVYLLPTVKLVSGVTCDKWAFDLSVTRGIGRFRIDQLRHEMEQPQANRLNFVGRVPLLRGRSTSALSCRAALDVELSTLDDFRLTARLFSGGSVAERVYQFRNLKVNTYDLIEVGEFP